MKPNPGEIVILTAIPRGMLDDLPEEDQRAIKETVGRPVLLNEYDDAGRAEIEFTDRDGQPHSLFVAPEFITRSGIDSKLELRARVEWEIKRAFLGVGLGNGIDLRQAQMVDGRKKEPTPKEITDNWSRVSLDELERNGIAHLDAHGFRYYIPALMLSLLDHYDSSSMRVIGTLGALYPKKGNLWEHHMYHYSLLSPAQKIAIAGFLEALPKLVELDGEDQKVVPRSLRNYWGQFLRATGTSS